MKDPKIRQTTALGAKVTKFGLSKNTKEVSDINFFHYLFLFIKVLVFKYVCIDSLAISSTGILHFFDIYKIFQKVFFIVHKLFASRLAKTHIVFFP
jgi:hypothetical protein